MNERVLRWYEKDEYLNTFMNLVKNAPEEIQCEIAVDIIVRASSFVDRDWEEYAAQVGDYDPKQYKRWYDKNPKVHAAIESMREMTNRQREEIIEEFSDKIIAYLNIEDVSGLL